MGGVGGGKRICYTYIGMSGNWCRLFTEWSSFYHEGGVKDRIC